jgi:hypothetical protein
MKIGKEAVLHRILWLSNTATSVSAIKQLMAALLYVGEKELREDEDIKNAVKGARKRIRARRTNAPQRHTLEMDEVDTLIRLAEENDTAWIFAMQTFLTMRYASFACIRPEHVEFNGDKFNLCVIDEKTELEEGAPRKILGIPCRPSAVWPRSVRWDSIVQRFCREVQAGRDSILHALKPYNKFKKELNELLKIVAPRLVVQGKLATRTGTHIARRTGACIHTQEGWMHEAIRHLGGWRDEREFAKYLQSVQTLEAMNEAAAGRQE